MAQNFAEKLGPSAAIAPLAAPLGAVPVFGFLQEDISAFVLFDYAAWSIVISYLCVSIVVVPLFVLTRKKVEWSASRIVVLGGILAIAPFVLTYCWLFIEALFQSQLTRFFTNVAGRDWTPFLAFLLSGIMVSAAFVLLQRSRR